MRLLIAHYFSSDPPRSGTYLIGILRLVIIYLVLRFVAYSGLCLRNITLIGLCNSTALPAISLLAGGEKNKRNKKGISVSHGSKIDK